MDTILGITLLANALLNIASVCTIIQCMLLMAGACLHHDEINNKMSCVCYLQTRFIEAIQVQIHTLWFEGRFIMLQARFLKSCFNHDQIIIAAAGWSIIIKFIAVKLVSWDMLIVGGDGDFLDQQLLLVLLLDHPKLFPLWKHRLNLTFQSWGPTRSTPHVQG